jgi:stage III sporulation protein AG
MNEFYKSIFNPKGKFGVWGIVILIILGISLMIVPGMFLDDKNERVVPEERPPESMESMRPTGSSLISLEEALARQITDILSQVEGVGHISVAVSLAAGQEQDYARNVNNQKAVVEEKDTQGGVRVTTETDEQTEYVLVQSRNEPLVLKEKAPEIKGVLVVAEGAKDVEMKIQLSKAVQTLLDLPAHKIMILPKER